MEPSEETYYLKRSKIKEYWPWHPQLFNHWYIEGFAELSQMPDMYKVTTWQSRLGPLYPIDPADCTITPEFPSEARLPDGWTSCTNFLYRQTPFKVLTKNIKMKLTFKRLAAVTQIWGHVMRHNSLPEFLNIRWPSTFDEAAALEEARFTYLGPLDSITVEWKGSKPFTLKMAEVRAPGPVQSYFESSGTGLRDLPLDLFEPV